MPGGYRRVDAASYSGRNAHSPGHPWLSTLLGRTGTQTRVGGRGMARCHTHASGLHRPECAAAASASTATTASSTATGAPRRPTASGVRWSPPVLRCPRAPTPRHPGRLALVTSSLFDRLSLATEPRQPGVQRGVAHGDPGQQLVASRFDRADHASSSSAGTGAAEDVALGPVAAELGEQRERRRVLDPFGHHVEPEVVAEVDRRAHDRQVALVVTMLPTNERSILSSSMGRCFRYASDE